MSSLDTAALIDSDVYDNCALLHPADHRFGDDLGSGRTGDQNSADNEVGLADGAVDVVAVGGDGVETATEDVVEFAETVQVQVDQRDLRAHAKSNLCSIGSDDAAADDAD